MNNTFTMLVGIPGSGKSTYAAKMIHARAKDISKGMSLPLIYWVSSDKIRKDWFGSEDIQGDASKVFEEMRRRAITLLRQGHDVIYDACNISSKHRRTLLHVLSKYAVKKECVILATPYEMCLAQNRKRDRVVPEEVITRMYKNWWTPFLAEGWDSIHIQYSNDSAGSLGLPECYAQQYMDYAQDNPFHPETLGEHLKQTRALLIQNCGISSSDNLAYAGILHDCGKPFTKEFYTGKGEPSEIAHYYQHSNVGAYNALFFEYPGKKQEDVLEISHLINYHMAPFSWIERDVNLQKRRTVLSDKTVDTLLVLHEADHLARKL